MQVLQLLKAKISELQKVLAGMAKMAGSTSKQTKKQLDMMCQYGGAEPEQHR